MGRKKKIECEEKRVNFNKLKRRIYFWGRKNYEKSQESKKRQKKSKIRSNSNKKIIENINC